MNNLGNVVLKVLICKNSYRRTPRPEKKVNSIFGSVKVILGMKIKNVGNDVLKVLAYVRTHPEELLSKKGKFLFLKRQSHFGVYDENENV